MLNFSDMNYDQLGSDLLQQPLLSSQIIPDTTDEEIHINKLVKPESVMKNSIKITQPNTQTGIQPNVSVNIKCNGFERNVTTAPKAQYVKKIPMNIVQVSEPKAMVKPQNSLIINENVVGNTPIVINKVNGNISGKY